jgi:hypothetical protein
MISLCSRSCSRAVDDHRHGLSGGWDDWGQKSSCRRSLGCNEIGIQRDTSGGQTSVEPQKRAVALKHESLAALSSILAIAALLRAFRPFRSNRRWGRGRQAEPSCRVVLARGYRSEAAS